MKILESQLKLFASKHILAFIVPAPEIAGSDQIAGYVLALFRETSIDALDRTDDSGYLQAGHIGSIDIRHDEDPNELYNIFKSKYPEEIL